MAKKKKKSSGFPLFNFGSPKKKKKKKKTKAQKKADRERLSHRLFIALIIIVTGTIFAGISFGFFFLEKYVKDTAPVAEPIGRLGLVESEKPSWYNDDLGLRIKNKAGGAQFTLNNNTAKLVGQNLDKLPWLYDVRVRTTKDTVLVYTKYRTPLAIVTHRNKKYYIAWKEPENLKENHNIIILDYFPIAALPLVEITGFKARTIPDTGDTWYADDVFEAVKLAELLRVRDTQIKTGKKLLEEIETIDISNIDERDKDGKGKPQIVLYARDKTPIYWGAPIGKAAAYLEAPAKDKLASLYQQFFDFGSVQNYRKIDLTLPQKSIPRPQ